MNSSETRHVLKRFVARYKGSSIPSEIELTDGRRCVMKMKGAGNGLESLAAEFIVNRAAFSLGWELPDAFVVEMPKDFPWEFGTDEFDDIVQKSYGLNLGLQHLGPCEAARETPEALRVKMVTLDVVFRNFDRSQQSANLLRDSKGKHWLVDHGSCRFLGPGLAGRPLDLPPGHLLAGTEADYFDLDLATKLLDSAVAAAEGLPGVWLDELGWARGQVREFITERRKR